MIISRVTALAALFAVLATTSLAFAADRQQARVPTAQRAAGAVTVVQLERVVVTARRLAADDAR